jgi:hypothetical protein
MRDKDHRELSVNHGTKGMLAFISGGAIRIKINGLHIGRPPTEQQYKTIIEFIKYNRGNIFDIELDRGMSWNEKK